MLGIPEMLPHEMLTTLEKNDHYCPYFVEKRDSEKFSNQLRFHGF